MKRVFEVKEENIRMDGHWAIGGINYYVNGFATIMVTGKKIPIACNIPLSAVRKYGKALFEEDIEISLKEFLGE
jgi:hypothetical protein